MSQTSTAILEHRTKAAELSKGTSGSGVYDLIERVITERGLTGKILDYGAGVGQLTRQLLELQRFDSVSATDIMSVPRDLSGKVEWIEQDLNIPLPGHEDTFDVVVAAEVIEHLENPRFMVREIFRILRPGGTAIITTPNNESWRALIALLVRGHFMAFSDSCYPAHITALLRKDFTRIFQESSFLAPSFYFTNYGGLPGCPEVLRWQQVSLGLLTGMRYSDNILAIAKKPLDT
jgi:SAM-dependent methyltransferase